MAIPIYTVLPYCVIVVVSDMVMVSIVAGSKAKSAITAAINAYSASTCIQFYPRRSEKDYIYFFKGSG